MKEADNVKILEPWDKLYRYGLNSGYRADWDTNNHSIEYYSDEYGHKNQIGALFFYDCESAAVKVLSAAINKQKKIGNIISSATITTTEVVDNIVLLDLEKGISRCTQLVTCLYNLGIDIMTDMFYNFQKKDSYDSIRESFFQLYSEDWKERMMAAKIVDDFFYSLPPLLGQSLTDFQNGHAFKQLLQEHGYEGYIFMEEFDSNTYCLLSSEHLTPPVHRDVDFDKELSKWLQ